MGLRDDLITLVDGVRQDVVEDLAGLRLHTVVLRTRQWSGLEKGLGDHSDTLVTLAPRPRVRPAPPLVSGEAGRREQGEIVVEKISATYTEADLLPRGLSSTQDFCWLVNDAEYDVVGKPSQGYLGWTVTLRRRGGRV